MMKVASICLWFSGLGFGIPGIYGIWYFLKTGNIATFMGFPTYGNGPFERIGIYTTVPLLVGFLLVCSLECICGWGLWHCEKGSAVLSLAIIPLELFFYIGFALPFGPPMIVIRVVLLWLIWSSLH
jgi:hypothetical protein